MSATKKFNDRKAGRKNIPCSICGEALDSVLDVRTASGIADANKRRRVCKNGHRQSTFEIREDHFFRLEQDAARFRAMAEMAAEWAASKYTPPQAQ